MKKLFAAMLTCCLLLSGCISYSSHNLAQVQPWPPAAAGTAKPTAYIRVEGQYLHNDQPLTGGFNQAGLEKLVLKQYQDSGLFSRVATSEQEADLYINVKVSNHESSSKAAAFITGLTLFIIPSTASNALSMQTEFMDGSGKLLGSVEKHETITTWMQLLLVFALPFGESTDNVLTRLSQSSLEQANQQKLI
ncbi:hypothetical protein SAMN05216296_0771 [Pseudomonas pohangensis]|uniref:Lipoprotein n=1 Tax=Pseudomonas pohangensis TaxID=364197 RepID=A0A1H2EHX9_9PSED|nr:hypothetical protein [Pseudomonas pohangensis]SDT94348.1 hypothetical protein SAMN05216296_0771 [Pseudomonas pohangensis]